MQKEIPQDSTPEVETVPNQVPSQENQQDINKWIQAFQDCV